MVKKYCNHTRPCVYKFSNMSTAGRVRRCRFLYIRPTVCITPV